MNRIFHDIHAAKDGIMNTPSGKVINFLKPDPSMICINDIANALSKVCRFGGMVNQDEVYSVAQHSVLVAAMAPDHLRQLALLHDASEAYLGDVVKPLKLIIGKPYEEIERRFMEVICEKFGLYLEDMQLIKKYDDLALSMEHARWQVAGEAEIYKWCEAMRHLNLIPMGMQTGPARRLFMSYFKRLFK